MAKNIADFLQRRSPAQHVDREAVTQQVGADIALRWLQACLFEGLAQHAVDDRR